MDVHTDKLWPKVKTSILITIKDWLQDQSFFFQSQNNSTYINSPHSIQKKDYETNSPLNPRASNFGQAITAQLFPLVPILIQNSWRQQKQADVRNLPPILSTNLIPLIDLRAFSVIMITAGSHFPIIVIFFLFSFNCCNF